MSARALAVGALCALAGCGGADEAAVVGDWRCRGTLMEYTSATLGSAGLRHSARMTGFRSYRADGTFDATMRVELETGGGVRVVGQLSDSAEFRHEPGTIETREIRLTGRWQLRGRRLRHELEAGPMPATAQGADIPAALLLRRAPGELILEIDGDRLETHTDKRRRVDGDEAGAPTSWAGHMSCKNRSRVG